MSRPALGAVICLACCSHAPPAREAAPPQTQAPARPPPAPAPAPAPEKKHRDSTPEEKAWFETVKSAIGPEWTARIATAVDKNDPEGCRDFVVERHLVVEFVVDAEGVFTSARVKESSGLAYIDQIGPQTFTAVHRVPAPPRSYVGRKLPFAFTVNVRPNPYGCAK